MTNTKESLIKDAIGKLQVISFKYKDQLKVVEPWLLGINKKGLLQLSAYQIDGISDSGEYGRRLYNIDNMESFSNTGVSFNAEDIERLEKYNPKDSRMEKIIAFI